ncbi:hypothetical protein [Salinarchaeum laminariae]|uniref:hypothetical protein n=1 Tax=Salinarchaeum laminariae TaxID=869888 RepID=UPI0020C07F96|nr:hypothetical protein [Salinarchaeum laminariae]
MSPAQTPIENGGPPGIATVILGIFVVLADLVLVYGLLATGGLPPIAVYGATALVAVLIGGSFLAVVGRRVVGDGAVNGGDPPFRTRLARVVVSITVLTGVTFLFGYGGGLLLALIAAVGGPEPTTADGDLLRNRLLEWPDRNREFMQTNGHGTLPLRP